MSEPVKRSIEISDEGYVACFQHDDKGDVECLETMPLLEIIQNFVMGDVHGPYVKPDEVAKVEAQLAGALAFVRSYREHG